MADNNNPNGEGFKGPEADDTNFITEPVSAMKKSMHNFLVFWFLCLAVAAVYGLLCCWPAAPNTAARAKSNDSLQTVLQKVKSNLKTTPPDSLGIQLEKALTLTAQLNKKPEPFENGMEKNYILIALFAGLLGGVVHAFSSLMDFRGQRRLFRSWALWYFGTPLIGALLSVIIYWILRAGLIPGSVSTDSISIYGVAALGSLTGLFTDKATTKLAEILDTWFSSSKTRGGILNPPTQAQGKPPLKP